MGVFAAFLQHLPQFAAHALAFILACVASLKPLLAISLQFRLLLLCECCHVTAAKT